MTDVIKTYENTLYKVRSKKWGHPLGKAMSITGHILKLAGKWGAPFTGILGSALTVGSKLLNPNPNVASCLSVTHIEDGFKEVSNNLPIIQIQLEELRKNAKKMMKTAAAETNVELNVKFKDGLKEIEAFCNKIFTKKDIFGIINLIDASYNYFNEVQVRTNQCLDEDMLSEYMDFLTKEQGIEACLLFFNYCMGLHSKFLFLSVLYHSYKNDFDELENQFSIFNQFNIRLTEQLWCMDLENKTELFPADEWETHTGMHQSAMEGNLEDIQFYLDHLGHEKNPGARIEGKFKGLTPMHAAALHGHLNVVQLIKSTLDISNPSDAKGWTVLHDAAFYGHLAIVQELVKDLKDPNPGAEGFDGRSPVHEAAFGGNLKIIKFYYKILPAYITIIDANAWNAIHYAAFKGHIKVVKFLADLEIISIDLRTKKGETACDIAKRNGHQNVVDFLNSWRISPNRLPHETRQEGAIRRMRESARNGKSYEEMISRIRKETVSELEAGFKENLASLSGSGWPATVKPCPDYNKGSCAYNSFCHEGDDPQMAHNQTNKQNVHMCVICETLFGAGNFHPAKSCVLLKMLDTQSDAEESSEEEESNESESEEESNEESGSSTSNSDDSD